MSDVGNREIPNDFFRNERKVLDSERRSFAKGFHLRSESEKQQLRTENKELKELVNIDSKTGLYNKGFFDQEGKRLEAEQQRGFPYAVVVIDLDNFKKNANDKYGHHVGDMVISAFADLISNNPDKNSNNSKFRRSDYVCRIGGDEFGVLMPNYVHSPRQDGVDQISEKAANLEEDLIRDFRAVLTGDKFKDFPELEKVGLSLGMAMPENDNEPFEEVFKRADTNMYASKARKKSER